MKEWQTSPSSSTAAVVSATPPAASTSASASASESVEVKDDARSTDAKASARAEALRLLTAVQCLADAYDAHCRAVTSSAPASASTAPATASASASASTSSSLASCKQPDSKQAAADAKQLLALASKRLVEVLLTPFDDTALCEACVRGSSRCVDRRQRGLFDGDEATHDLPSPQLYDDAPSAQALEHLRTASLRLLNAVCMEHWCFINSLLAAGLVGALRDVLRVQSRNVTLLRAAATSSTSGGGDRSMSALLSEWFAAPTPRLTLPTVNGTVHSFALPPLPLCEAEEARWVMWFRTLQETSYGASADLSVRFRPHPLSPDQSASCCDHKRLQEAVALGAQPPSQPRLRWSRYRAVHWMLHAMVVVGCRSRRVFRAAMSAITHCVTANDALWWEVASSEQFWQIVFGVYDAVLVTAPVIGHHGYFQSSFWLAVGRMLGVDALLHPREGAAAPRPAPAFPDSPMITSADYHHITKCVLSDCCDLPRVVASLVAQYLAPTNAVDAPRVVLSAVLRARGVGGLSRLLTEVQAVFQSGWVPPRAMVLALSEQPSAVEALIELDAKAWTKHPAFDERRSAMQRAEALRQMQVEAEDMGADERSAFGAADPILRHLIRAPWDGYGNSYYPGATCAIFVNILSICVPDPEPQRPLRTRRHHAPWFLRHYRPLFTAQRFEKWKSGASLRPDLLASRVEALQRIIAELDAEFPPNSIFQFQF
jgi:hypothetical protein